MLGSLATLTGDVWKRYQIGYCEKNNTFNKTDGHKSMHTEMQKTTRTMAALSLIGGRGKQRSEKTDTKDPIHSIQIKFSDIEKIMPTLKHNLQREVIVQM